MSPFNAFTFIQGLETLPLRMERHCENAKKVADYLSKHDKVSKVIYPSHMKDEYLKRANDYLKNGFGALVGFELKNGADSGKKFIDNLNLLYHVANIGDSRSLAIHPSSTTHSQLSADEQIAAGVTPGYVRLSIGIEHIDDIIEDIEQALNKS
jgi:O-acetylhomoserine (thiol)-lyase